VSCSSDLLIFWTLSHQLLEKRSHQFGLSVCFCFYAQLLYASRILAMARASVCLSICLSACLWHCCIVSKQCKLGSWYLYWGLPQGLVFLWQNSLPLGEEVPFEWGRQRGVPPIKDVILLLLAHLLWKRLQICTDMLLIITITCHKLFSFINIDDL